MKNHKLPFFWSWLPEGWRADLEEQRRQWLFFGCTDHEWRIKNFLALLGMLKAAWYELLPVSLQYLKKIDPNFVYEHDLACNDEITENLESSFRYDYFTGSLKKFRLAALVGFFTYAGFGYLDVTCLPTSYQISWALRLIGCVILLLTFFLTYKPEQYYRFHQYLNGFIGAYYGISISIMVAIAKPYEIAYNTYYTGIINVLICVYFFGNLLFANGFWVGLMVVLSYECVAIFDQHLLTEDQLSHHIFINNNFFLIGSYFCFLIASNLSERYARIEFLTRYAVTHKFLEYYSGMESISSTPEAIRQEIINMRKSPGKFRKFLLQSLFESETESSGRYLDS